MTSTPWSFAAGSVLQARSAAVLAARATPALGASGTAALGASGTAAISGTVTAAEGSTPIAGIEVCAYSTTAELFAVECAITDATGKYEATGLPGGQYDVEFFAPGESGLNYLTQFYNGKASEAEAEAVTVAEGAVASGVDAALLPGAEISGRVTEVEGNPVASIQVCALAAAEAFTERCASTDAAGEYTLESLASGEYKIEFTVPFGSELNYATQFYEGVASLPPATAVPTTAGAPATTGIDATLQVGGVIGGTVTSAATKAALAGVLVCAADAPNGVERCAETGPGGTYAIRGLPTGGYVVEFLPFEAGAEGYAPQFYKEAATQAAAEAVTVTAGSTTLGVDAALLERVPANVTRPAIAGSPVEGQTLTVIQGTWTNAPSGVTDEWGQCDATGVIETCHTIAMTPTYAPTAADIGCTIRIREHASNGAGIGTPAFVFSPPTALVTTASGGAGTCRPAPSAAQAWPPPTASSGVSSETAHSASAAQLKALLLRLLVPHGKAARLAALHAHGRYVATFSSLAAGRLSISWYLVPRGAHVSAMKPKPKPVLVASGKLTTKASGTAKLTIKLTAAGRALLAKRKPLKLTAKGAFAPKGRGTLNATRSFRLAR